MGDALLLAAYAGIGLVPDTGVSWWLPRTVGPVRAAELTLRGRRLTGAAAVEWGVASEAVSGDEFEARLAALNAMAQDAVRERLRHVVTPDPQAVTDRLHALGLK